MLKDITLGQYYPGDTAIHKLDPRAKIAFAFAFIICLFITHSFYGYIPALAFILLAQGMARIPLRFLLRQLKALWMLMLITFIFNAFFSNVGTEIFRWGTIAVTDEGLIMAAKLILRLALLIMGTSLLTLTTSPVQLTDGLEAIMRPLSVIKFPAHELAMMMSIALRFIPTLLEETDRIMKAQMARGSDFSSGKFAHRIRAVVPILIPLFVSAFRRADELAMAMEARCYSGGAGRTRMKKMRYERRDLGALLIVASLCALMAVF